MVEIKIGIIAAPEFATNIANQLKEDLPDVLSNNINEGTTWDFEIVTDRLTSVAEDSQVMLDRVLTKQKNRDWDYTLCLTDIPIFFEKRVSIARVNYDYNTALVSLPAFGWFSRKRIDSMVLYLLEDLYYQYSNAVTPKEHEKKLNDIFLLNQVKKREIEESGKTILRYLFYPKINGLITILLGMVYANQPWKIIPSLKNLVAVSFGSGAYALIFPTIWQIAFEYHSLRLAALMLLGITAFTLWILRSYNLWERETRGSDQVFRRLYNTTTLVTLLLAVGFSYLLLTLLFFITTLVFVQPEFYSQQVSGSPTILNYIQLAWTAASIGTIAGAVGIGLEDAEIVRNATYSYRQQERYEEMKRRREEEEEEEEGDDTSRDDTARSDSAE